jgi:hypothetical protein
LLVAMVVLHRLSLQTPPALLSRCWPMAVLHFNVVRFVLFFP